MREKALEICLRYGAFSCVGAEVVVLKAASGDVGNFDPHVLKVVGWSAEVEIFDVHHHELGAWGGDDTVEEKLGSGEASRLGADFAGVADMVTANGEADMMGLGFLGSFGDDEAQLCGFAAGRNGRSLR
jgi:hypothetical protein